METWKDRAIAETAEPRADEWVPQVNRRDFVALTVLSGFALAARPVAAQTLIVTDT